MPIKRERNLLWDLLVATVILLMSTYTIFGANLYHYLLEPIRQINPEIFSSDYMVQAQNAFTPQFLTNAIYVFFLKTGLKYNTINLVLYMLSYFVFSSGIIAISRYSLKKYSFVMVGVILLLSLYSRATHPIGGNLVWATMFKYDNMAMCFIPWTIYWVMRKRWWTAIAFCTIATLFHFHVGIYCAVFIVPILAYDSIKTKKLKNLFVILPWAAVCFGMYTIMIFQKTIDTNVFTNDEFIKIFAIFRNSHHMVPSSWGIQAYANFTAFICSVLLLTYLFKSQLPEHRNLLILLFYLIAIMTICILFNFIFVEVYPLSLAAKLQPGRVIPMFSLLLYILLGYYCAKYFNDKIRGGLLLLVCISLISVVYSGIIALVFSTIIAFYSLTSYEKKQNISITTISITLVFGIISTFLIKFILQDRLEYSIFHYIYKYFYPVSIIILFCIFKSLDKAHQYVNKCRNIFNSVLVVFSVLFLIFMPWVNRISFRSPYIEIKTLEQRFTGNGLDKSLETLALRFKENSEVDSVVLGNPFDDNVVGFRFYSQRASVVTFKNVPQNDPAIKEWMDRQLDLGVAYKKDNGYYGKAAQAFFNINPLELIDYCNKYGITHILTNEPINLIEGKYLSFGFSMFDKEDNWVVLERK